jgi:hypothetical protein
LASEKQKDYDAADILYVDTQWERLLELNKTVLVLSDKRWLPHRGPASKIFTLMLAVLAIAPLLAIAYIFRDAPWERLPEKLAGIITTTDWPRALLHQLDKLAMLGVVLGQLYLMKRARKLERLTLSPAGIQYTSPLPDFLKRFKSDWFFPWNQVQKAELGVPNIRAHDPQFVMLTLTSASGKQRIFPAHWVDPDRYFRPLFQFAFSLKPATPDAITQSVMSSEVMQYLSKNVPGLVIDSTLSTVAIATSLEKNPHGRIALGIVFLLMIYAFLDLILGPESYIDQPSSLLPLYISAGILGAIVSGLWLFKSTLAVAEKIGLAMLIGTLVAVAMLPGALRINAITDTKGAVSYDYFVTQGADGVVLRPVVEGMPVIDYFAKNDFWGRFGKNDTYPVSLRKGGLGFYQFDSSAIVDDIRQHETK